MNVRRESVRDLLVCLGLGVVTLMLYLPLRDHHFIHLDDHQYVTENPHVARGMTWENCAWAFTHFHAANWHPLTWLSLMLDAQVYGLNPAGFLATNVLLHITATLLLFIALRQLTAAVWKSAAVAALFAWHPVHVESVAWVAERKDVLSAVFWMLTICLYTRHVAAKSRVYYYLALVSFAVGLMAKPMLVTLPCVLLLLDYWPLGRIGHGGLMKEKLPFFILSIANSIVTVAAQKSDSAVTSLDAISLSRRLGHSLTSYLDYLVSAIWPANLAIYYPFPASQSARDIVLALGVLCVITWIAIRLRHSQPWMIVGWLWYLGTLVPVIGLVQVGMQASADRYTYLPLIGIFMAVIWTGAAMVRALGLPAMIGRGAAGAAMIGCLLAARNQISYWRDSETLFNHTLSVTGKNPLALVNLGAGTWDNHEYGRAMAFYRTALIWDPSNADAAKGIAVMYVMEEMPEKALALFQQIIKFRPAYGNAYIGAGVILSHFGRDAEAIPTLERAVQLEPNNDDGWFELGALYLRNNRAKDAAGCFKKSLEILPDRADACMNLAAACQLTGQAGEAETAFKAGLRMAPAYPGLNGAYGMFLLQQNRIDAALQYLLKAIQLKQGDARAFTYAGLILAAQHHDREALNLLRTAVAMAPNESNALRGLAWILSTSSDSSLRDGPQALQLAERIAQGAGGENDPRVLDTLAAAQAENGQYDQAQRTAQLAIEMSKRAGQAQFAGDIQKRLECYRAGKPWRETAAGI